MQRCVSIVLIAREDFDLGMQHGEIAAVAIELHLAEQRDPLPGFHAPRQMLPVKPFGHQQTAARVAELHLQQPDVLAAKARQLGRPDFRHHGRHLTRGQLRNRLQIAAVFVAKRHIRQKIFRRAQPLAFEHGRARRPDAFQVGEFCPGIERQGLSVVYNSLQ